MDEEDQQLTPWEDDWLDNAEESYYGGKFDLEIAYPDEMDNFYKAPNSEGISSPSFLDKLGGKVYGLAILWVVLSTKPWK